MNWKNITLSCFVGFGLPSAGVAQQVDNSQRDALVVQADSAQGRGNLVAAASLYEEACKGFHARACYGAGNIYRVGGNGVLQNNTKAIEFLQLSCNGPYAPACNTLGFMYATLPAPQTDLSRAGALFRRACDLNSAEGCYRLGDFYQLGKGVPQSNELAISSYRKSLSLDPNYVYARNALTSLGQR
jgi:TPR repeat protein